MDQTVVHRWTTVWSRFYEIIFYSAVCLNVKFSIIKIIWKFNFVCIFFIDFCFGLMGKACFSCWVVIEIRLQYNINKKLELQKLQLSKFFLWKHTNLWQYFSLSLCAWKLRKTNFLSSLPDNHDVTAFKIILLGWHHLLHCFILFLTIKNIQCIRT